MKNEHEPKRMDDRIRPVSHIEKKTMMKTTYWWFALIGVLLCIPLFNFILVPIVAVVGLGVYIIYISSKYSRKPGEALHPEEASSQDDLPGLTNQYQMERNRRRDEESDVS